MVDDDLARLKAKLDHPASGGSRADGELETLKAKRGKPADSVGGERADEVETLKAKLASTPVATEGERTTSNPLKTKSLERGAPRRTLPRSAAVGVASQRAKLDVRHETADDEADPVFDIAFVLVIGLWGIGVALALTRGAEWRFFAFCVVVTVAVALFGLLDSRRRSHESPGVKVVRPSPGQQPKGPR
jgi:hypothetical protein